MEAGCSSLLLVAESCPHKALSCLPLSPTTKHKHSTKLSPYTVMTSVFQLLIKSNKIFLSMYVTKKKDKV